jgi:CDP-diacylglycerol---serine O-phosphatidyltransferase
MWLISNIPNFITLGNLLCGCIGILFVLEGNLMAGAGLVFLAALLDFLDGFLARLLKSFSELGKQLDSLADMVSFGVLPAFILFKTIQFSLLTTGVNSVLSGDLSVVPGALGGTPFLAPFLALLIPVFSAWRLAKFNIDTRQTHGFIGLPTPANALFFASLPFILRIFPAHFDLYSGPVTKGEGGVADFIDLGAKILGNMFSETASASNYILPDNPAARFFFNPYVLCALAPIMSFLLVSPLPLIGLKFKSFGLRGNALRYLLIIGAVLLLILFQFAGIPLIIILYILISLFEHFIKKNENNPHS